MGIFYKIKLVKIEHKNYIWHYYFIFGDAFLGIILKLLRLSVGREMMLDSL